MKSPIPQEERGRTISYIIVVCVGILFAVVLLHLKQVGDILGKVLGAAMPFIVGFAIALLLLPIVKKVEWFFTKLVFRRKAHPKLSRTLSVIIAYIVMLALLAGFFAILVPQLISSISSILQYIANFDISRFVLRTSRGISAWLSGIHLLGIEGAELAAAWDEAVAEFAANLSSNSSADFVSFSSDLLSWILNYSSNLLNGIKSFSSGVYTVVLQLVIGMISAFYLLIDKETFCAQVKKVLYATLKPDACNRMIYWARRANTIFMGFITGKILDSLIIGLLCYVCMLLFGIEYPLLISVIVGITNVIPFFGPYIGAIPSLLILLLVNPLSALWFLVFIIILQQIDGNVIGPFILGDYVGLSPFWIMLAIVIGGELFGFLGMLVGVPVFALIYAVARAWTVSRLDARNMPKETAAYVEIPEHIPETKQTRRKKK